MDNGEIVSTVNLNGYVIHSSTSKPSSPGSRVVNAPSASGRLERQSSSACQAWLEQCKNVFSDHEKATETIYALQDELERVRGQLSAKTDDHERHTKRIGDLETQLVEKETQLVEKNSELEIMKTRLAELLHLNENLGAKNQELENFRAGLVQYVNTPPQVLQPPTSSTANPPDSVATRGVHNPPAAMVVSAVIDSTVSTAAATPEEGVFLAAPPAEHNLSAQEMIDDMPPELPIMEMESPESRSPNQLDTSVNSTPSSSDDSMENHALSIAELHSMELGMTSVSEDVKAELVGELIHPESPELARPKKTVTFSPNPPETFLISSPLSTSGKRKRAESMVKAYTCQMCMVSYDSLPELRSHACPLRLYECSYEGCGKTFGTSYSKKRHEKTHAEKEEMEKRKTFRQFMPAC